MIPHPPLSLAKGEATRTTDPHSAMLGSNTRMEAKHLEQRRVQSDMKKTV
jgi:hypothetical protein